MTEITVTTASTAMTSSCRGRTGPTGAMSGTGSSPSLSARYGVRLPSDGVTVKQSFHLLYLNEAAIAIHTGSQQESCCRRTVQLADQRSHLRRRGETLVPDDGARAHDPVAVSHPRGAQHGRRRRVHRAPGRGHPPVCRCKPPHPPPDADWSTPRRFPAQAP